MFLVLHYNKSFITGMNSLKPTLRIWSLIKTFFNSKMVMYKLCFCLYMILEETPCYVRTFRTLLTAPITLAPPKTL